MKQTDVVDLMFNKEIAELIHNTFEEISKITDKYHKDNLSTTIAFTQTMQALIVDVVKKEVYKHDIFGGMENE